MVIGAKPWLADTKQPLYDAGKAAVKRGTNLLLVLVLLQVIQGVSSFLEPRPICKAFYKLSWIQTMHFSFYSNFCRINSFNRKVWLKSSWVYLFFSSDWTKHVFVQCLTQTLTSSARERLFLSPGLSRTWQEGVLSWCPSEGSTTDRIPRTRKWAGRSQTLWDICSRLHT